MNRLILCSAGLLALATAGCMVGPNYRRPSAPAAPTFAEIPPAASLAAGGWRVADPRDEALRADWWALFGDPQLDRLEARLDAGNFTLQQAEANVRAARAAVRFNRAALFPTVGIGPYVGLERLSANQPYFSAAADNSGETETSLPLDLGYEVDLWGRIRRSITAARAQAAATAADRETVRLALHAELALDYFNWRSAIAQEELLQATVKAYAQALDLNQQRYAGGASPLSDVEQAQAQLKEAEVDATDITAERSNYEHAIAVLLGQPPGAVALEGMSLMRHAPALPAVPGLLPSELLERRPDIAAAERRMAAANEQIGIARAAFYPTLGLSASGGFMGNSVANWFLWPSRFWAVGPALSETLFDGGRRQANAQIATADYDSAVAGYRETCLTAFQEVEDNLAALRQLQVEALQQHAATDAARQTLDISQTRYSGGVDTYLQIITWQTAALQNERNDIDIMRRRLEATVLLVKALGGGWDSRLEPGRA